MTVKIGDRVRVTKDEQVLIGEVDRVYARSFSLIPDDLLESVAINSSWSVKVLSPPIPAGFDEPGALVLDDLSDLWRRNSNGFWDCLDAQGAEYKGWTFEILSQTYSLQLLSVTETLDRRG